MGGIVHVVGAGLSGLACATALNQAGRRVSVYEATDHAGGRCRSWHDAHLDRTIDNGNHLILGANRECFTYLDRIGGRDGLLTWDPVAIPFLELPSGRTWTLRPGAGPLPLWLTDPSRRVPDSWVGDYFSLLKLALAGRHQTVADLLPVDHPLTERLWKPLAVSILNTPYEAGSARLLRRVLFRTLLRGAAACRPSIAGPGGLSAALVDPALSFLAEQGASLHFGQRLKAVEQGPDGAAVALVFPGNHRVLAPDDQVVLALPAEAVGALLPNLPAPTRFHAILNAHFRLDGPVQLPGGHPVLGLIGGTAEWLFARGDTVSITVSAADALLDHGDLPALLWRDVARVLGLDPTQIPPHRIVKERRATFAATPDQNRLRPGPRLARNLFLAGDWTDTGLPATIEGAIQSGHRAAKICQSGRMAGHMSQSRSG